MNPQNSGYTILAMSIPMINHTDKYIKLNTCNGTNSHTGTYADRKAPQLCSHDCLLKYIIHPIVSLVTLANSQR